MESSEVDEEKENNEMNTKEWSNGELKKEGTLQSQNDAFFRFLKSLITHQ